MPITHDASAVTVIIPTRNRPDALCRALAAIAVAAPPGTDVLVVDSAGDTSGTREVAAAAGVRYVRAELPGAALARNLGLASTSASVAVFTDDDCCPRPGWLEPLAAPFADPAVGFVTGEVIGPGEGTAADIVGIGEQRWRWPGDPLRMGSGANMAFRRDTALSIGGFDTSLGPGAPIPSGEDHELFLRALHRGWEGRHAPTSIVDHDDGRTRWQTVRLCYGYGLGSGEICRRARRLDPALARTMLRTRLWSEGIRAVGRDLRRGWEVPALRGVAMTLGVVVGRVRGGRAPVDAGVQPLKR